MTTGKTIALTIRTFVSKVIYLLFQCAAYVCHSLSSKEQVSFNFVTAVAVCSDFGAQKIKSVTVSSISPSICHEVLGLYAMILVF